MIEAKAINKVYNEKTKAVHAAIDVSLKIERGMRVYIHGPSGAGKSTLLHMLGALSTPTSGEVFYGQRNIYSISDRKRSAVRNSSFGFVFQFYHLLPELTVLENVMLPAMIKGGERTSSVRKRAGELLSSVGMEKRVSHTPGELSGGEVQRVAIARALINEPEVLFCDEPTGNLDSEMGKEIYSLIRALSEKRDMSVLVVSHQDVERDFFDAEYFMKDGRVEEAEALASLGGNS